MAGQEPPEVRARWLIDQLEQEARQFGFASSFLSRTEGSSPLLAEPPAVQKAIAFQLVHSCFYFHSKKPGYEKHEVGPFAARIAVRILNKNPGWTEEDWIQVLKNFWLGSFKEPYVATFQQDIINALEKFASGRKLGPRLVETLISLNAAMGQEEAVEYLRAAYQKLEKQIGALSYNLPLYPMDAGEAWSDVALHHLGSAGETRRVKWLALLKHCEKTSGSGPSTKWAKTARELMADLGPSEFKTQVLAWFPLVDKPRTQPLPTHPGVPDPNWLILPPHAEILKGLVWCCGLEEDQELSRAVTNLCLGAYRKIPSKGAREVKVGNACVTALGIMPGMDGVGQLALLKVRVKLATAQKLIEKAFEATAARVGIPREELEEMAVPAYGLTEVGRGSETFGDFTAELTVTGPDATEISWRKPDGKRQQSVPAVVKEQFPADWKDFQTAAKDIQRMLPAQRERIDNLFREPRSWPFVKWRERYLDHPLVGVLARRLIWEFTRNDRVTAGIFFNGQLVDLDLKPLSALDDTASVRLWHPIGKDAEEIVAWRAWLDAQQIQQPFKQAHREIYLLTDAEKQTRTYSNRFAAHILRQHQFNALCGARGWKNSLRLMVDAEYLPATVLLPQWDLRAEFWVEGIGQEYGADTNESGVFHHLATDQVRFYRLNAPRHAAHAGGGGYHPGHHQDSGEPLPLEEIPPLVFSEVMRDVDLFVGVASVGNDPTWNDGGPNGRYRDYWQRVSFGELGASARLRREVLERLVPRLKIASKCSFEENFLIVQGSLRAYKIHLGSGNILMKPNDQYLCIVPKQGPANDGRVFLPFEGDRTLSLIISKALLLADDAKIKDPSITSQIKR